MSDWIDVREAWARLEANVRPLGAERVPLAVAAGRVLREAVQVDRDLPAFDRAAMDGFAVRATDVRAATKAAPARLCIAGESLPGAPYGVPVAPGDAVRIMTGAPVPADCDAIVPVEESSGFGGTTVELYAAVEAGKHITPRGSERSAGDALFAPGRRLSPADIGALAMVGQSTLEVGRLPRVAVLSTGNELVPHANVPGPAQIRDSNGPMLAALAAPHAVEVVALGPAPDDLPALVAAVRRGLGFDTLLVTGGVSMGAYDLVREALEASRVLLHFDRVALQPGKPTGFGTHTGGAVLALPGNPVSAFTTFRLFALPTLRLQAGESSARPVWSTAIARFDWQRQNPKWLFFPGRRVEKAAALEAQRGVFEVERGKHEAQRGVFEVENGKLEGERADFKVERGDFEVERVAYVGSGDLLAYARADCQIVLPPEVERVRPGDRVAVWSL